jgi:hypothetical protein
MENQQTQDNTWEIVIDTWDGYCPNWYNNEYASYGNKNQGVVCDYIDIIDQNVLTQGRGVANLTAGTQAGAVTTLITSILGIAT